MNIEDEKKNDDGPDARAGEVISFEDASHPHVHARKEEKLNKVRKAFRAVTRERLKADRITRRKKKGKGSSKGRKK